VEAKEMGAYDYIKKPFKADVIKLIVKLSRVSEPQTSWQATKLLSVPRVPCDISSTNMKMKATPK